MGVAGLLGKVIVFLFVWGNSLSSAAEVTRVSSSSGSVCFVESAVESVLRFRDFHCPRDLDFRAFFGVIEGDEAMLQKALNLVHENKDEYVALLFYASWCHFSKTFWPSFSIVSSLFTTIPHIAIEESDVRPSILSKYGVHGFPTFFLLNSTMRARYHGSRTLSSLVAFYSDVTGLKAASRDQVSLETIGHLANHEMQNNTERDSCPFSWARSPENVLRQETYLALATIFVVLRLLYFLYPTLLASAQTAWRRHIPNVSFWILVEHPLAFLNRTIQLFSSLKDPCKQTNLQGGAKNARAWASRSLATVSIGDATTSRGCQQ